MMSCLEVSSLKKSFGSRDRRIEALRGVSFSLERGDIAWIKGPSGAGKTTLLNILGLLSVCDWGAYRFKGSDMTSLSVRQRTELRRTVFSTIFQGGNLFPRLTGLENVLVGMSGGAAGDAQAARAALDKANARELAGRRAGTMSGGEQQRVAVARALARQSQVILADEPTAGLDDGNAACVLALLRKAAEQGLTVIVASHDTRAGAIANRRMDLMNGVLL
jgi:ABC-type lipoprotein export system ATPase subunit